MKKLQLHWQILIALIVAILWGFFLTDYVYLIGWMGTLFLRALKMIIIPLIFSSIVTGVANIGDAENLGRLGAKTFGYYLVTTTLAILTGLFFVNILQPGVGAELGFSKMVDGLATAKDSFGDTLINIIPTNIFEALSKGQMLSIIFFALILGFFITKLDKKPGTFYEYNSLNKAPLDCRTIHFANDSSVNYDRPAFVEYPLLFVCFRRASIYNLINLEISCSLIPISFTI